MKYLTLNSKSLDPIEKSFVNLDMGTGNLFAISGKSDSGGGEEVDLWSAGFYIKDRPVDIDESVSVTVTKSAEVFGISKFELYVNSKNFSFSGGVILSESTLPGGGYSKPFIKFTGGYVGVYADSGFSVGNFTSNFTTVNKYTYDISKDGEKMYYNDEIGIVASNPETFISLFSSSIQSLLMKENLLVTFQGNFENINELILRIE